MDFAEFTAALDADPELRAAFKAAVAAAVAALAKRAEAQAEQQGEEQVDEEQPVTWEPWSGDVTVCMN